LGIITCRVSIVHRLAGAACIRCGRLAIARILWLALDTAFDRRRDGSVSTLGAANGDDAGRTLVTLLVCVGARLRRWRFLGKPQKRWLAKDGDADCRSRRGRASRALRNRQFPNAMPIALAGLTARSAGRVARVGNAVACPAFPLAESPTGPSR